MKKIFLCCGIAFFLLSCIHAYDDENSDIERKLIAEGYKISGTLELESDDLKKLGEDVAKSFLLKEKEILDKYKKKRDIDQVVMIVLGVENASKSESAALTATFENEIQKASQSFKFSNEDPNKKEYEQKSRDNESIDPASQPDKDAQIAPLITITMKLKKGKIIRKANSERVEYILSACATERESNTNDWSSKLFSQKKAVILEKKDSEKLREYKKKLEDQQRDSEQKIAQLILEKEQIKNKSELELKEQEIAHEKQKLLMLQKESARELERQKKITDLMISNQVSQSGRDAQSSQSSQSEAIPSLSFLASQKGAFWLIGLEGGVGERFTPNYNDSAQAAFSFRTKAGGGYRWNADYALSGFLTYEATFQDKGIPYTKNEMETTHSLGFGAMFQFLKYFYVSTGALVDTKDLGSDYISRTHKNINPFIETGGILMTDKYIGFSLGLRYVFALGDGNYLNRGISCSAGILFGI